MELEFPYQLVTFLDKEPHVNEPVYYGEHGWYPQIALKRRFKLNKTDEEDFIKSLKEYIDTIEPFTIATGGLIKPERMPVRVIEIVNEDVLKHFHTQLINNLNDVIISRYPERDGDNYYPHITAEYGDTFVIPVNDYVNKQFSLSNVWLLKDVGNENSQAFVKIR